MATGVIDRTFEFLAFHYQQQLSRQVWFLLWTLKGFLIYEGFYFLLPFTLDLPSDWTKKPFFMTKHEFLEPRRSNISNTKDNEVAGPSHLCETATSQVDKKMTIVDVDESESEEDTLYGWSVDDSVFDCWTDYTKKEETSHRADYNGTRRCVQVTANVEERKDNLMTPKKTQSETEENIKMKEECSTWKPKKENENNEILQCAQRTMR